jgi:hypothetical protein
MGNGTKPLEINGRYDWTRTSDLYRVNFEVTPLCGRAISGAMCCGLLEPGKLMSRLFRLTEKIGLRFWGEFFNLFDHPNFGPPDNNLTDALFGQSTQTLASSLGSGGTNGGFNNFYQIGGPRSLQLALKLRF